MQQLNFEASQVEKFSAESKQVARVKLNIEIYKTLKRVIQQHQLQDELRQQYRSTSSKANLNIVDFERKEKFSQISSVSLDFFIFEHFANQFYCLCSYNKRGPREYKEMRHIESQTVRKPEIPIEKRGVRDTGVIANGRFKAIPEMAPEFVVPDLTDCKFKPYVSYKTQEVIQSEFTTQDLYNAIYAHKVIDDFKNDKLNEDGSSKEPSNEELLTTEEAFIKARQTGSDIFCTEGKIAE